jgi:hypothetical protein
LGSSSKKFEKIIPNEWALLIDFRIIFVFAFSLVGHSVVVRVLFRSTVNIRFTSDKRFSDPVEQPYIGTVTKTHMPRITKDVYEIIMVNRKVLIFLNFFNYNPLI